MRTLDMILVDSDHCAVAYYADMNKINPASQRTPKEAANKIIRVWLDRMPCNIYGSEFEGTWHCVNCQTL